MRIPKDLSGQELIKLLFKNYNYVIIRQAGSHIRITTKMGGEHHITIPNHNPLKIGTLNGIINNIAGHLGLRKEDVIKELFK